MALRVGARASEQAGAHARQDRARRLVNVAAAALGLIVTAPVMILIAALVKLTTPGPILFTQVRVGMDRRNGGIDAGHRKRTTDLGGRPFRMYKFRTMYVTRDRLSQVWASPADPRVTPIGRVLRKYRLDELPQLINVLKGDMNLVGPRPEQPRIFLELRSQIDRYADRQRVAPGLTGLAQVNQHYDTSIEDVRRKVELDLEYIQRCSWSEDLKIMLRTVPVVLLRRGAW
jgi:lipopolysaccharide/colanic/teichoic acid biosynthesis glycosyltransferase